MKKVIKSGLKKIYQEEMKKCSDAVKDGKHPYHIFTISSIKDKKWPEIRIVVLRDFKFNPNVIYFNTDYRSPKIAQMKNNNNCCALFYDGIGKVQIRFHAKASIHYQDSIAYEIWKKTALQSRKCYMGEMNPSSEIQEWHPKFPITYLKKDPKLEHSEEGFQNFTCIKLNVIETEILKLYHDGHVRFNIKNKILNFIAP